MLLLALPGVASAAQLVDRDATGVKIAVNAKGQALVTYRKPSGLVRHVLVWGAINAIPPQEGAHQAKFKLDYSGGWGTYHTLYWKTFGSTCGRYDGPVARERRRRLQGARRLVLGRAELAAAAPGSRLHALAPRR